jgi:hypothetical protein
LDLRGIEVYNYQNLYMFYIVWLVLAILVAVYASQKGRSGIGFFFLSVLLSPLVGLIVAFVVKPVVKPICAAKNVPLVKSEMRDWIGEMGDFTRRIQLAIDEGRNDDAWGLTHKFQTWCIERINAQRYSIKSAGTLLSAPQDFFVKILLSEGNYRQALIHTMYQGYLDSRNLKRYPKQIKLIFKKCGFKETQDRVALLIYERLKEEPIGFSQGFDVIRGAVSTWS